MTIFREDEFSRKLKLNHLPKSLAHQKTGINQPINSHHLEPPQTRTDSMLWKVIMMSL